MAVYNINQEILSEIYNVNSEALVDAYDVAGNKVFDPYIDGRLLLFEDNFEGNALNPNNWEPEIGGYIRGKSYEYIRPGNVSVQNSLLRLRCLKENHNNFTWSSGSIHSRSKQSFTFGRFEAKIKLPNAFNGAFWLMGPSFRVMYPDDDNETYAYGTQYSGVENIYNWPECGEIDIVESWSSVQKSNPQCNLWSYTGSSINHGTFPVSIDSSNEWHIYAVEKTSEYIAAFIDDIEYRRWTYSDYNINTIQAYVDKPFYMLFTIAIGSENDISQGFRDETMYVDWVRVYAPVGVNTHIYPTSISIQPTLSLKQGYRTYMNPTISPAETTDRRVTWESLNPSVVRVDGQYIYGESIGETDIVVTTVNGLSSQCHVAVVSPS